MSVLVSESRFSKHGEGEVMDLTDEALIELYFARSEEAIPATQAAYGPYCRAIALGILDSEEDAEECLADVWLRVWNAVPPQRPDCFKGWLAAVTRNQAVTMCRARARRPAQTEEAAAELAQALTHGPEEDFAAKELGGAISAFLRDQPDKTRGVFLRRYWYGDTVEEAARWAGWSVSKTKSALFRMRNRLRAYLEKEGFFP